MWDLTRYKSHKIEAKTKKSERGISMMEAQVVIVGAGIVGLTVARELLQRGCEKILILEKESKPGLHASGRNSGILHAGVYYTPDSLKARSCLNGNILMKEYCHSKGLSIIETGKLIVTKDEHELDTLRELARRAQLNGADIELVDEKTAREIEPCAKTVKYALWVKNTAAVNPQEILNSLLKELLSSGKVSINFNCPFLDIKNSKTAITNQGLVTFEYFINTAGSYCDQVAHKFGLAKNYRIVPFKGIYWKLKKSSPLFEKIRGNIYPVPDIKNPFLGVHFSRSCSGEVYVGPTAIPALGREHYGILNGIDREAPRILLDNVTLFINHKQFTAIALTEPLKYFKFCFYRDASRLVEKLEMNHLEFSSKVGIRPQLINTKRKSLEMDFIVERDGNSIHVLNPISPAFTASMDLAQKICNLLEGYNGKQRQ